jgi:membrane protein YqaA with SNARE-associated domain
MGYALLFVSAFGAATLLPFYSEVTLVALLAGGENAVLVWAIATLGNTLGAMVNWLIGRYLTHFEQRSWFPFKPEKLHRSQLWFQKYGRWSLLLAWMPVGGDALTFIAGVMRVPIISFTLLTATGKGARYAVVILLFYGVG